MNREKGFSLTEIMVVLAIVGIVAAIALPTFFSSTLPHMKLKGAARDIYTTLQTARSKAVNSNIQYAVQFNLDASPDTYQLMKWNGTSWVADTSFAMKTLDSPVDINNISGTTTGLYTISFSPVGTAGADAEIKLNRTDNANDKFKVVVVSSTGYVSIVTGW